VAYAIDAAMTQAPLPSSAALLKWYDANARVLPWRAPPGTPLMDPYKVWLSEIMLQQTTVPTVIPYFQRFIKLWPTVKKLGNAPQEDVLKEWAGLGYYARARNLHKCAQAVAALGAFPRTVDGLQALPGIGPYTAAAIASIAFGARAVVVDGNIERVVSRLFRLETALPAAKPAIRDLMDAITPQKRVGDFAQAMMDLGSGVCTPRNPKCSSCPWRAVCEAHSAGDAESFPRKAPKFEKPTRHGTAYWLEAAGHVWLVRRPAKGLLGGMVAFPTDTWALRKPKRAPPIEAKWQSLEFPVEHVFTHFRLQLTIMHAHLPRRINLEEGFWHPISEIERAGLPTVFAKVARLVLG
jgi:A/G-specific adenine glycosylase